MSWEAFTIGDFLKRSKIPIDIIDDQKYKRVTIRINHNGVSLRDVEKGKKIGTKKQFVLKAGQFILSKIDARYGAFGIAPADVDNAIITGNFWAYDVDYNLVDIEWFNQFTNSPTFYDVCERASSGITHRKYLDEKVFLNYKIHLPNVIEQKIIIDEIKKNKTIINELKKEINKEDYFLTQLRQVFLREAMQGKLVPQDPNDEPASELLKRIKAEKEKLITEGKIKKQKSLPEITPEETPYQIPSSWVWCRLDEISNVGTGATPLTSNIDYYKNGSIPWLTSSATNELFVHRAENFITEKALKETNCKIYNEGTLIVAMYGQGKTRGQISELNIKSSTNQAVAAIVLHDNNSILRAYIKYFFRKIYDEIRELAQGGAQPNLNMQKIKNTFIPLPPLAEQQRIVSKLNELMQFCDQLEQNINTTKEQTNLLLQTVLREALEPGEK